jgi:hypothetical protein
MDASDVQQPTCGQGLAEHAELHVRLAALLAAMAGNLEAHLAAVGPDSSSRPEREAYESLLATHRRLAAELGALADEMTGYRDLPMAEHDMEKIASAEAVGALQAFLAAEREAADWLSRSAAALESALPRS